MQRNGIHSIVGLEGGLYFYNSQLNANKITQMLVNAHNKTLTTLNNDP